MVENSQTIWEVDVIAVQFYFQTDGCCIGHWVLVESENCDAVANQELLFDLRQIGLSHNETRPEKNLLAE